MATPRKPRNTATKQPTGTTAPQHIQNVSTGLPESLQVTFPEFNSRQPSDLYRPSSSSVPRTNASTFQTESLVAAEQFNSLKLEESNLKNLNQSALNAIKATDIGQLIVEYQIGLERIRGSGTKLRAEQYRTMNEELKVKLEQARGLNIESRIQSESMKLDLEQAKQGVIGADIEGYRDLKPIAQMAWKAKLAEARQRAQEAIAEYDGETV